MAAKKSKSRLQAELVIAEEELATAMSRAKVGRMWRGMPRPEWARSMVEHWKRRVIEEDAAAEKSKAAASKAVESGKARVAEIKKALSAL